MKKTFLTILALIGTGLCFDHCVCTDDSQSTADATTLSVCADPGSIETGIWPVYFYGDGCPDEDGLEIQDGQCYSPATCLNDDKFLTACINAGATGARCWQED
ncbi:uncharacterized protein PV06_05589 [Exophiala oligosperma]|uniref:Uncharacterized protein n=2 Tax=Chaetothyriales TaxID=34395 RepID=A0A0D2DG93_9EURO|nr:uncharacterized protein PV06_05589 [Exophiala oligosperma]KAJ9643137.1 hypothetical protein H2204_002032 [Knufia peltigerae]KIW41998.1 hypothetical protein PV06_05589 [Exophiala oligosperma]